MDALNILTIAGLIRESPDCNTTSFDGVANLTASWITHPQLEFIVQDPATMERWAAPPSDAPLTPSGRVSTREISSPLLWRAWRADRHGAYGSFARQMFDAFGDYLVPEGYSAVGPESHEFWTVVDGSLTLYQKHAPRPS